MAHAKARRREGMSISYPRVFVRGRWYKLRTSGLRVSERWQISDGRIDRLVVFKLLFLPDGEESLDDFCPSSLDERHLTWNIPFCLRLLLFRWRLGLVIPPA
jgi:hypothetical protein